MSTEIQEQTPVIDPPVSPGAMIRAARDRARFSLDDLAGQIKLARHTLEALERDDFSALLEPVYVRGYYRKCAKVLDVSETKLIEAYEARVSPRAPAAPSKLRLASGTELGSTSRLPVPMSAVAAIGVVLVCSFIWFARPGSRPAPSQPLPVPVDAVPAASEPAPVESPGAEAATGAVDLAPPTSDALTASPAADAAAGTTPVVPMAATSPAPAAPTTAPTPTPAPPSAPATAAATGGTGSLALSFSATSWIRVDDAAGKTLINGLMRAGDRQQLSGATPLSVFIGNAPGVSLEYAGKPVDLKPHTRDNATARLSLPLAP